MAATEDILPKFVRFFLFVFQHFVPGGLRFRMKAKIITTVLGLGARYVCFKYKQPGYVCFVADYLELVVSYPWQKYFSL